MGSATDKLVVLARGLGTRMRRAADHATLSDAQASAADSGVKALIPVGRPFLDYVLTAVAAAGIRRVCLVIGPEHDAIRDYYDQQVQPRRLEVEYAVQPEPRGTADAVLAAESFAGGEPFLVINSDNYYPAEALGRLRQEPGSALALFDRQSMLAGSNLSEERLQKFAFVEIDERKCLRRIIEKPDEAMVRSLPSARWLSMNCWRFSPAIFKACRAIGPSPRGEFEIPSAVQYARETLGETFRVVEVRAAVLDLSSREDISPVAAQLKDMQVDF